MLTRLLSAVPLLVLSMRGSTARMRASVLIKPVAAQLPPLNPYSYTPRPKAFPHRASPVSPIFSLCEEPQIRPDKSIQ